MCRVPQDLGAIDKSLRSGHQRGGQAGQRFDVGGQVNAGAVGGHRGQAAGLGQPLQAAVLSLGATPVGVQALLVGVRDHLAAGAVDDQGRAWMNPAAQAPDAHHEGQPQSSGNHGGV